MHQLKEVSPREQLSGRAGVAEWIALGAVITGSVGALVGAARCTNWGTRQSRVHVAASPDPSTVTAPHGDKLRAR